MKKVFSLIAACIILVSSTGTTIALHYCGRSLEDVAVFGKAKPCCEGMEMPSGCCHDEKFQVKSDTYKADQPVSNTGFVPYLIAEEAYPQFDFNLHFRNSQSPFLTYTCESPPPGRDICIQVQSFLI